MIKSSTINQEKQIAKMIEMASQSEQKENKLYVNKGKKKKRKRKRRL